MTNAIIPEVLKREVSEPNNSKQQTLNINLNQNIDRRVSNYNTNTYNSTFNENHTVKRGGFFRFIFDVLTVPFKIVYKIYETIEKKYDIKNNLKIDKEKLVRSKFVKKYLRSTDNSYDFEEIY